MPSTAIVEVEQIPIDVILTSATNPRKHFDSQQLAELAESIRTVGIQVPLLLRPRGHDRAPFEIVGGERRYRAAQIAGLATVPAIVRQMTDRESLESQVIENLQRADLGPMEEAQAYASLALPADVLAAKVGKTVPYVTQRLKLLGLIEDGRAALSAGVLNLTLALLIARLQESDQQKALLYAMDPKRVTEGKDLAERIADARQRIAEDQSWYRCASETELREWIKGHTLLTLKGVAWRLDDPDLIPLAGPCTECPKRAGNSAALFGDLAAEEDTCTDPACYGKKEKAKVKEVLHATGGVRLASGVSHQPLKEGATHLKQGQWVEAKPGSCPHVVTGVTEAGRVKTVCPNQKCGTHKHRVSKPLAKGESAQSWEEKQEAAREKEQAYVASELPIRKAVYDAIRPKLKGAKLLRHAIVALDAAWLVLAQLRGIAIEGDDWKAAQAAERAVRAAVDKAKDAELEGWLADMLASTAVLVDGYEYDQPKAAREKLWALGRSVGVDCDAIAARSAKPIIQAAALPAKKAAQKKAVRK